MNKLQSERLSILAAKDEINELRAAGLTIVESSPISGCDKATVVSVVKLKRTFNMCGVRYWRVVGPASHRNINSDLSIVGLKQFNIIPQFVLDEVPVVDEEAIKKAWGLK